LNELALFAGAGGGILGGKLLGWRTVCAVELDAYCRRVLLARQRDRFLPRFPIWDNIQTFDGKPWRGHIDVVSGGFPCVDISVAGRGAGIEGERSGLWKHMARIVGEVRPRFVFVENAPVLVKRGLAVVIGDLAAMGYDARWGVVGAHHVGAVHRRDRMWVVADSVRWGLSQSESKPSKKRTSRASQRTCATRQSWWDIEPNVVRVAYGVPNRVDRIRALGNAQVPAVAALAWRLLGGPSR
jgi:DNA (cytosine-5)-methyltransferase 1